MIGCATTMGMPIIVTEQQPFKPTVAELDLTGCEKHSKTKFSMFVPAVRERLMSMSHVKNIYLVGIEAHVCVLQTTLDLIREGYRVFLVVDAIGSQRSSDRQAALQRLEKAGAIITTSESCVYELMKDAKHPKFKQILSLVKDLQTKRIDNFGKGTSARL